MFNNSIKFIGVTSYVFYIFLNFLDIFYFNANIVLLFVFLLVISFFVLKINLKKILNDIIFKDFFKNITIFKKIFKNLNNLFLLNIIMFLKNMYIYFFFLNVLYFIFYKIANNYNSLKKIYIFKIINILFLNLINVYLLNLKKIF